MHSNLDKGALSFDIEGQVSGLVASPQDTFRTWNQPWICDLMMNNQVEKPSLASGLNYCQHNGDVLLYLTRQKRINHCHSIFSLLVVVHSIDPCAWSWFMPSWLSWLIGLVVVRSDASDVRARLGMKGSAFECLSSTIFKPELCCWA